MSCIGRDIFGSDEGEGGFIYSKPVFLGWGIVYRAKYERFYASFLSKVCSVGKICNE